jgi:uncharacterized membrane protein
LAVGWDINNVSQIVGHVSDPAFQLGFVFAFGGEFTMFGVPDAYATQAFGINDSGHIVGAFSVDPFALRQAFVRIGDTYTPLDVPGANTSAAHGINEAGWIVGHFVDAAGVTHGFLATPVSEPASALLLAGGFAVLQARRHRRRATNVLDGSRKRGV